MSVSTECLIFRDILKLVIKQYHTLHNPVFNFVGIVFLPNFLRDHLVPVKNGLNFVLVGNFRMKSFAFSKFLLLLGFFS